MNASAIATTSVSAGEPGAATTNDQFVLAGRNDSFLPAKIDVAEVAVYNRSLADHELNAIEEYARRRYALY